MGLLAVLKLQPIHVPEMAVETEAGPAAWKDLRSDVGEGMVVDFQRAMLTA